MPFAVAVDVDRGRLTVAMVVLLAAGCSLRANYGGTAYRCDDGTTCPSGFTCESGVCVAGAGTPDARLFSSDAPVPGPPDADQAVPDATPGGDGVLVSPRKPLGTTVVVDGDLGEWGSQKFIGFAIDQGARYWQNEAAYKPSATVSFASQHDAIYLYLAIRVLDDIAVNDSGTLYHDDAIGIYLDANDDALGAYAMDDHELWVARDGRNQEYAPNPAALTYDVVTSEIPDGSGWVAELRIVRATMGGTNPLAAELGVDFLIADDDGIGNTREDADGLWYIDSRTHCPSCCPNETEPQAYCDTSVFGKLELTQ